MPLALALFLSLFMAPEQAAVEEKARAIENELIVPCCWTMPVSQHQSPAAEEIKQEVRAMLAQGKTEPQIYEFYEAKYGERIFARPRARGFNLLAYVLPAVFVVFASIVLVFVLKKLRLPGESPAAAPAGNIDPKYAARLERELKEIE